MRILHLASFSGNIGDNFNHLGFRKWFQDLVGGIEIDWCNLEIRDYYRKQKSFDCSFLDLVNSCDLFVIGGGNYFEFWVDSSPTGTSISITEEIFDKIETPIFFNSLGVDIHQGYTPNSISKFKSFIKKITADSQKFLVSVRNDGAMHTLSGLFEDSVLSKIHKVPDPAFYVKDIPVNPRSFYFEDHLQKTIVVNLASDMPQLRFSSYVDGVDGFAREFARFVNRIMEENKEIAFVFIPHIYKDLQVIFAVLENLNDEFRRARVFVSEYGTGFEHSKSILSFYKRASLVLGMRFHSNVIPLSYNIPTIGLVNYPQIEALYNEIERPEDVVYVNSSGFSNDLFEKVVKILNDTMVSCDVSLNVDNLESNFKVVLLHWLNSIGLIRE
jgi:polysaccharide pyruvyl transferase WcaK-like protein